MISRLLPQIDLHKFLRAFVLLFVLNVGFAMANTLLRSLLLIHYGAKIMPLMTMGLGVLELVAVFLSAAWAKSRRKTDLLNQIVAIIAILIGIVYFSLYLNISVLLPLAFVVLGGLAGVAYIQIDIIINHLFSLEELSTAYPKLTIAFSLSNIAAGLMLGSLIGIVGNHQAFLIPMVVLVLTLWSSFSLYRRYPTLLTTQSEPLALQLKRAFVDTPTLRGSTKKTHATWEQEVRNFFDSLKSLKNSTLLRYLVILTIFSSVGGEFFAFGLNTSVTQHFSGDRLTQFLAYLEVAISLCTLVFRLFFLTETVKRLSFSQGYLFHSSVSLLGLAALSFLFSTSYSYTYLVSSVLYIAIILGTLVYGNNALYRLVPEKERDKARTLTQGIGESVSIILSAWVVAVLVNILSVTAVLQISLIPAIAYCFFASKLSRVAYRSLERMIKGKNEAEIRDAVEILAERRGKELMLPLVALYPHADTEIKKQIIYALGEIHTKDAYRFLHHAIFREPMELRKSLVRALGKFRGNHGYLLMYLIQQKAPASVLRECLYALVPNRRKILDLVSRDFLRSADPQIRTEAIAIADELRDSSPQDIEIISGYTAPGNPLAVVEQALKTLYHRARDKRPFVIKGVERLLNSLQKEEVIAGLALVGQLMLKPFESFLFHRIDNESDDEIKSAALRSLSVLKPEVAVDYFSYYLTNRHAQSTFYSRAFSKLGTDLKQRIVSTIARGPVEAIDNAVRNMMLYSHSVKSEIEVLYASIPQKFQAK